MSTASAPIEIGHVVLTVNDLDKMASFYEAAVGLAPLARDAAAARLGAGGRTLVELRGDKAARPVSRREAGLFHTAFLMPSRDSLARWLVHAAETRLPLSGASDHLVSEAIYLSDPEGNGIEVYVDRTRDHWHDANGNIHMTTEPLDLGALAAAAEGPWHGAPEGAVVGHVHLQVGEVPAAETFWRDTVGLPVTTRYPGAAFYGAGGYHHHIATNTWNSRGAGMRRDPAAGLSEVVLAADPAEYARLAAGPGTALADPWGTAVRIERKAA